MNDEGAQNPNDTVLHQDAHEDLIDSHIAAASTQAAITDLAAITGGEAPTEAEHNAVRTRVNLLTQVLRDMGAIPSA
jgi:hypothetical protein